MTAAKNERGAVLIFMTLMIVLPDDHGSHGFGHWPPRVYPVQGQPAVDAAALAAASAIHTGDTTQVEYRVKAFNSTNTYLDSPNNQIGSANITYVNYDASTNTFTSQGGTLAGANGVRVALETTNPYGGTPNTPMKSPLFLTPLFNLFGIPTTNTVNVSVSAVAIVKSAPDLPIAMEQTLCGVKKPQRSISKNRGEAPAIECHGRNFRLHNLLHQQREQNSNLQLAHGFHRLLRGGLCRYWFLH